MKIKSILECGFFVFLLCWIDVVYWYMLWFKDVLFNKKIIFVIDFEFFMFSMWDVCFEYVYSLYFWIKYFEYFMIVFKEGWIVDWCVFVVLIIMGWEEVEMCVFFLDKQFDVVKVLIDVLGIEKIWWCYFFVFNDFYYNTVC